jgi:copper oxidase (laccase) domain-containing protein
MNNLLYQPVDTFPLGVNVCFSTKTDGSVAVGGGSEPTDENVRNAKAFLQKHDFVLPSTKLFVTYGADRTYTDIDRVSKDNAGKPFVTDALYTTETGLTMTLTVGDCIATVIYDPIAHLFGVLHLGRHASVEGLIEAFAFEVAATVDSQPSNWRVWMSPSIQLAENRLEYFDPLWPEQWLDYTELDEQNLIHIDVPAHNRDRFIELGVPVAQIDISPIDTYTDKQYFSHRAATELRDESRQGRMMVAAMMTEPLEAVL